MLIGQKLSFILSLLLTLGILTACETRETKQDAQQIAGVKSKLAQSKAGYEIVDCRLPGQVRSLGRNNVFVAPRRLIRTSKSDCAIRGGEFIAYDRSDYNTALSIWMAEAMTGDVEAQTYVGEIYEKGLAGTPDYKLAAVWYEKAADQNHAPAMLNLGRLYENGYGVEKDLLTAINYYRRATGLEGNNIAFASAFEESKRVNERKINELESQLGKEQQNTAQLRAQLTRLSTEKNRYDQRLSTYQHEIKVQQEKLQSYEKSSDTGYSKELEQQQQQLSRQVGDANQQITRQQQEIAELRNQLQVLEQESTAGQALVAQKDARIGELEKQIAFSSDEIQQMKDAVSGKNQEINALQDEISAIKQSLSARDASREDLSRYQLLLAEAEKELQQEIEGKDRLLNDLNSRENKITKLESNLQQTATTQDKTLGARDQEIHQLQEQLAKAEQNLARNEQAIREKTDQLVSIEGEVAQLEKAVADAPTQQDIMAVEKKLRESQAAYALEKQKEAKLARELEQVESRLAAVAPDMAPTINIKFPRSIKKVSEGTFTVDVAAASTLQIVGSVFPALDVTRLSVNQEVVELDKNGLFLAPVDVGTNPKDIRISVKDRAGRSGSYLLKVRPSQDATLALAGDGSLYSRKVKFGTYHALVIGNNKYTRAGGWNALDNAENDAVGVAQVLRDYYGFQTTLLLNATRVEILEALEQYRSTLTKDDNLLVFYSGHGYLDNDNDQGYWIPVDAKVDSTLNWISNATISDQVRAMNASNVLIIADSCYSAALTRSGVNALRSGLTKEEKKEKVLEDIKTRTRMVLTAGGIQPVADGGGGDHSVFSAALLKALEVNKAVLDGETLSRAINLSVSTTTLRSTRQTPRYSPLARGGHMGGEFYFVPKAVKM